MSGRVRYDDLDDGVPVRVRWGKHRAVVVRVGSEVFALAEDCSHAKVSLCGGEVDDDECTIECPKHGATFDLRTGEALTLPATQPVRVFDVQHHGDEIVVSVKE